MKLLKFGLIVTFLIIQRISAQPAYGNSPADKAITSGTNVSVKQIVENQINAAKEKELSGRVRVLYLNAPKLQKPVYNSSIEFIKSIKETTLKLSILVLASLIVFGFVFYRRKKQTNLKFTSELNDRNLKENIKLLRDEKLLIKQNSFSKDKRTSYTQGELLLKSRINQFEKMKKNLSETKLVTQ